MSGGSGSFLKTLCATRLEDIMNREYAIEILEAVECRTLEYDSSLAREAYRTLDRLKSTAQNIELQNRIYYAKYNTRK
jgi:hypothetical protein